jgi:ATPase family associated with various cellular activities (AAA)
MMAERISPFEPPGLASVHLQALSAELAWLEAVLAARLESYFKDSQPGADLAPPSLPPESALSLLIERAGLGPTERLVLALAMAPHLRPELLDPLLIKNAAVDRGYTIFGGRKGAAHGGFLPTGETAAFLIAGAELSARLALRSMFAPSHVFQREALVRLEHDGLGEPLLSGALVCSEETVAWLATGERPRPDFSGSFPARRLTTRLGWDDLVLADDVRSEIAIILGWIAHGRDIMADWGLGRVLKPGYRCLFYGPPGTGKTLTASLIGQSSGRDVYRIDLSMLVSKYIGETEKNLARVFDRAQHENWILFFDEADALFGKRTSASSANDRYANQEVSYLLQRIEDFDGFVILATNLKGNIDDAFARRFQSMVHFPMPDAPQRLALWQGMLREPSRREADVRLDDLAERHEISGGAIANVVRFAAINALTAGRGAISTADLMLGIVKELRKEGRTI